MEIALDPSLDLAEPLIYDRDAGYIRDGATKYPFVREQSVEIANDGRHRWTCHSRIVGGPAAGTPVVTCRRGQRGYEYGIWQWWTVAEDGTLTEISEATCADLVDPDWTQQRRYWRACRAVGLAKGESKYFKWKGHGQAVDDGFPYGDGGAFAAVVRCTANQVWIRPISPQELDEYGIAWRAGLSVS